MAQDTQRTHVLTRIRKGDYIIPSNDGAQLWRISSYEETGDGEYLDPSGKWRKIIGTRWQTHSYNLTVAQLHARYGDDLPDDFLDWDQWEHDAGGFHSRADAIKDVVAR